LRLSATGAASWCLRYRPHGRTNPERLTLGPLSTIPLHEARRRAKKLLGEVADGENPQAIRRAKAEAVSFDVLADRYLEEYARPNKTSWRNDQTYLKPG
jgi:hypothetical protein